MLQLKKLRIGAKLAISAAIGVVITAAMVVVQIRVGTVTDKLDEQVRSNEIIQREAVTAELALRRVLIMSRDSRAAINSKQLESAIERMGGFTADGIAAFDRVSAKALTQADRDQLAKAKDLFMRNTAMMKDLAVGRR